MNAPKQLTRKAGPLPVYAWVALALVSALLYRHYAAGSSASAQTPVTPTLGSAAQQPAGGQGNAASNAGSDLLSALDANTAAADALLHAVQGGGMGVAGSGGSGSAGSSTAAATAPTVTDSGVNPSTALPPADTNPAITPTPPPYDPNTPTYIIPGVDGAPPTYFTPPGYFQNEQGYGIVPNPGTGADQSDVVSRYLANHSDLTQTTFSAVSTPTPTVVQPAPVDTGGVIQPAGTLKSGNLTAV